MMRAFVLSTLILSLFAVTGCSAKKEAGVVAEPGDYDAYVTPPGAADAAQKAAQAASGPKK